MQLEPSQQRLTNVRFADDWLIFGSSVTDVIEIFEMLSYELEHAGLCVNTSKSKLFTTDAKAACRAAPVLVEAAGSMLELVRSVHTHKYLGRMFSDDLTKHGHCNVNYRLSCGWLR